jgi:hypothetical protein
MIHLNYIFPTKKNLFFFRKNILETVRTMPNWVLGDSKKPYGDSRGYIRPGKVLGR